MRAAGAWSRQCQSMSVSRHSNKLDFAGQVAWTKLQRNKRSIKSCSYVGRSLCKPIVPLTGVEGSIVPQKECRNCLKCTNTALNTDRATAMMGTSLTQPDYFHQEGENGLATRV